MKKNKKRSLNIKNKNQNQNQIKKAYQCLRGTPL